jgi:hypothetical protein
MRSTYSCSCTWYIHVCIHTYIHMFYVLVTWHEESQKQMPGLCTRLEKFVFNVCNQKAPFLWLLFCAGLWPGNKSCCARTKSWRWVWLRMFVFVYMATYLIIQISMLPINKIMKVGLTAYVCVCVYGHLSEHSNFHVITYMSIEFPCFSQDYAHMHIPTPYRCLACHTVKILVAAKHTSKCGFLRNITYTK